MKLDDGLGSGLLKSFYDQLATSFQTPARFIGIAGQIETGEPIGVATLVQLPWKAIPPNSQVLLARSVSHYRGADPTAIAALGAIAQSSDYHIDTAPLPIVQLGAVHALREIHTRETLPFLKTLLDSPNPDIRYDAVIGIAQYAISFPVAAAGQKHAVMATFTPAPTATDDVRSHYPAMDIFAQNESEYISYWKGWLQSHIGQ